MPSPMTLRADAFRPPKPPRVIGPCRNMRNTLANKNNSHLYFPSIGRRRQVALETVSTRPSPGQEVKENQERGLCPDGSIYSETQWRLVSWLLSTAPQLPLMTPQ